MNPVPFGSGGLTAVKRIFFLRGTGPYSGHSGAPLLRGQILNDKHFLGLSSPIHHITGAGVVGAHIGLRSNGIHQTAATNEQCPLLLDLCGVAKAKFRAS